MGRKTFSFELHNLVDPTFSIQTVEHPDGTYVYDYVVRNGPSAKQFIRRWSFTSQATDLSAAGPGWSATRIPSVASRQNGQPNASPTGAIVGSQVVFYSGSGNEVQPGASVEGFRVLSRYSPGFTTAFVGSGSSFDIPSELPSVVADQIGALVTSGFDSQVVLILGPKYPPGWSPKAIAADFQVGMTRLVRSGKLSPNSRFVTEALSALGRIVQGGAVTMGDFVKSLPEPSPGLEREIATAMQLKLKNGALVHDLRTRLDSPSF